MKAKAPHWPIERVKTLVAQGHFFVQRARALAFFSTREEAYLTIEEVTAQLTLRQFAHSISQTQDVCDVYGVVLTDNGGWYLKICIDESVPEVAVISFHPLERPLRTNGGEVKPKGWQATVPKARGGR
jgi:hypothetical protein